MKWNDDWRQELEMKNEPCFTRLCECRNTYNDIKIISKYMHKYNEDKTKEECVDRTLEWISSWNNQYEFFDLSVAKYKELYA